MRNARRAVIGVLAVGLTILPLVAIGARTNGASRLDLALIDGVISIVESNYVHPVDSHELTKDALKGMLNRLDPHSDYMDEEEFKQTTSTISGEFGGLGIEISEQSGIPKVIAPIEGTPAARAGLQPGDLIVSINGESAQDMNLDKVVRVLRGEPGTQVTITIVRGTQEPFDVTITRSIIQVQTVKSKLYPDKIAYVRITQFGENTPKDFKRAVQGMRKEAGGSFKGFVLDLRNDPGGLLTSAVAIAGNFLKGGTVVTIKGRRKGDNHAYSVPGTGALLPDVPVVVLINGASASASEIVAGALQDRDRGTVMGTQSFGKGSVQTIIALNGHGALRLTTALYYTPDGRSIQGQGIAPDIVVEAPKETQIAGVVLPHENSLRGAFRNPGSIKGKSEKTGNPGETENTARSKAKYSAPIKADLIGTEQDAQLKAAIDRLTGSNNGGNASPEKKG
jgi:carboxyl-terminal processing protease